MSYIKLFHELSKKDVHISGGKGASLSELTRVGISVPPGFVIIAEAFDRFLHETDLKVEIDSIVHELNYKDMHRIEHASETIRDLIHDARMPKDLQEEILEAYTKLCGVASESSRRRSLSAATPSGLVAVRSSATAEDSSQASLAGELETYLNTTEKVLLSNIKKCLSS